MIKAYYKPLFLSLYGHAGYAPSGQDIVCAGVSTLYGTLLRVLGDLDYSDRCLHVYDDGCERIISFTPDSTEHGVTVSHVFDTIWAGILLLAETYPDYIVAEKRDSK